MNAGTDLARDIQTGFLNRISLTPVRGVALVLGQLAGVGTVALVQAVFYVVIAYLIGVRPEAGPGGVVVLLALAVAIGVAFGAVGIFLALRTGSGESVQGLFPVLFAFLLISSMNFPRNLIEEDWFRWAATANPVSYLIEGIRSISSEVPRTRHTRKRKIKSGGCETFRLARYVSHQVTLLATKKCSASSGFRYVPVACQRRTRNPAASRAYMQRFGRR